MVLPFRENESEATRHLSVRGILFKASHDSFRLEITNRRLIEIEDEEDFEDIEDRFN